MASLSDYPALARGRRHREMSSLSQLNRNREAFPRHFDLSYIAAMLSTPFGIAGCGILLVVLILPSIVTILGWFAVLYLGFLFYSRLLDPSPLRLQPIPTISEDSQRIHRELTNVQENATSSYSVDLHEGDLFCWEAAIFGRAQQVFFFRIYFPRNYPDAPPKVTFVGGASHPNIARNVDRNGQLNLGILRQWDPEITMSTVLIAICSLVGV